MAARETPFTLFPYTTLFRSASFGTEPMPRDAGLNQAFADIFTRFPNTLFVVAGGDDEQRVREPREDVRERLVEPRVARHRLGAERGRSEERRVGKEGKWRLARCHSKKKTQSCCRE